MAEPLIVFARLLAKSGKEDAVKAECLKMIEPTRAEAGKIFYDCHECDENPAVFYFREAWSGRDALQAHMGTPHMQTMDEAMADLLVEHHSVARTKMISKPAGG